MNEYSEKSQPSIGFASAAASLLFLSFMAIFFSEPSYFGFTDSEGQTVNRLVDLLVLPTMAIGVIGDGAQPLAIFDRLPFLLCAMLWLAIGGVIGLPVTEIALPRSDRLLKYSLACLVGLALLSSLTLMIGLAGQLGSRWPLVGTVTLCVFAAGSIFRSVRSKDVKSEALPEDPLQPADIGSLWLRRLIPPAVCALGVCYILGSVLPPWEFDVLEYHLQAPKEYWQMGGIEFLPHNVYANMPLGAEMHSLAWMTIAGTESGWWFGGIVGKLVTGLISVVTALAIGRFLAVRCGAGAGWVGAGLLLAAPGNMHVAMSGLIDMVVAAYLVAAWIVIVEVQSESNSRTSNGGGGIDSPASLPLLEQCCGGQGKSMVQWFVIGTLAGACAACKYPGLLLAVIPAAGWLIYSYRIRIRSLPLVFGAFAIALLCTCVPWLIRNALWTGNPVYPLASSWFAVPGVTVDGLENWNRIHSPQEAAKGASAFSPTQLWQDLRKPLLASGYTNPVLMFLAVLATGSALTRTRKDWTLGALVLAAWLLVVWLVATHRIDRFWLPLLPLFALAAGRGVTVVASRCYGFLACLFPLVGMLFGLLVALGGASPHDNRFFVDHYVLEAGSLMEDSSGMLTPTAWANSSLGPESKLLCVGFAKPYLLRLENAYATCFNESPAELLLRNKSPDEQHRALVASGFTHLVIDWVDIRRYRSPGNYGFSDWPQPQDISSMVESGVFKPVETRFDPADFQVLEVGLAPPK